MEEKRMGGENEQENMTPKGNLMVWVAVVVVVLIVGGFFLLRGKNRSTPSASPSSLSTMPSPKDNPPNSGTTVTIKNFAFGPASLTVNKGDTVTWTNEDSAEHQIASDSGDAVSFSGPAMPQGQSFSFKFDSTGTFPYHCVIHPSMKGMITVK
jgi:plastocyanin